MESERIDELIADLSSPDGRWEDAFADITRVRSVGCGTEYDSAVGLAIVALPLSGDGRRIYIDAAACAATVKLGAVAIVLAETDAAGLAPLTIDAVLSQ